jgi:hypothetical protein
MRTECKRLSYWEFVNRIHTRGSCCEKGLRVHCVCRVSIRCPVHGSICVGTHD